MKAGRELDALIAEKVFKLKVTHCKGDPQAESVLGRFDFWNVEPSDVDWDTILSNKGSLRKYSTNPAEAYQLLQFMAEDGKQIRILNKAMNGDYWWVYIDNHCVQGSTLMEAICLIAVKIYS